VECRSEFGAEKTVASVELDRNFSPKWGAFFRKWYEHLVQLRGELLNHKRDYLVTRQAAKQPRFISSNSRS